MARSAVAIRHQSQALPNTSRSTRGRGARGARLAHVGVRPAVRIDHERHLARTARALLPRPGALEEYGVEVPRGTSLVRRLQWQHSPREAAAEADGPAAGLPRQPRRQVDARGRRHVFGERRGACAPPGRVTRRPGRGGRARGRVAAAAAEVEEAEEAEEAEEDEEEAMAEEEAAEEEEEEEEEAEEGNKV